MTPNRAGMAVMLVRRSKSRFPRRGMGQDDGDDSSGLNPNLALTAALAATPSILGGVAQVVKAENTPGVAVSGITSGSAVTGITAGSSGLIWLLLIGLGVALIAGRGK